MKKLLVLTAVVMMTAGTTGCRCCQWLFRGGQQYPVAMPAASYAEPCNPCMSAPVAAPSACDPCGAPGVITPGPGA